MGTHRGNSIANTHLIKHFHISIWNWIKSDACCHRFSCVKCVISVLQDLPSPLQNEDPEFKTVSSLNLDQQDAMKIAWRYQNLPKVQVNPILHGETEMNVYSQWMVLSHPWHCVQTVLSSSSRFGHYYDLSKHMEQDLLQKAKIHTFYLPEVQTAPTHLRYTLQL